MPSPMSSPMSSFRPEIEVKIAVQTPAAARKLIRGAGFGVHVPRVFEVNVVYDFSDLRLRAAGKVLRLRQAGKVSTLTFKGKSRESHHKIREEIETHVDNSAAVERVFEELNLQPVFRYEKYRTEFTSGKTGGVIMLDETPIGTFLEIEGPARWIDRTARKLGFSPADYITQSYGLLYLQYCRELDVKPSNMVFRRKR
jgi:adenylate cyclase class 2